MYMFFLDLKIHNLKYSFNEKRAQLFFINYKLLTQFSELNEINISGERLIFHDFLMSRN